jgi:hypothetical protein
MIKTIRQIIELINEFDKVTILRIKPASVVLDIDVIQKRRDRICGEHALLSGRCVYVSPDLIITMIIR